MGRKKKHKKKTAFEVMFPPTKYEPAYTEEDWANITIGLAVTIFIMALLSTIAQLLLSTT